MTSRYCIIKRKSCFLCHKHYLANGYDQSYAVQPQSVCEKNLPPASKKKDNRTNTGKSQTQLSKGRRLKTLTLQRPVEVEVAFSQ